MINLSKFVRPNTVTIFARGANRRGRFVSLLLDNVAIPLPGRVRLDTTRSIGRSSVAQVSRSPLERFVVDNIRIDPQTIVVSGTLSATPLGLVGQFTGSAGSIVRMDLRALAKLHQIQSYREPVIVVTPFGVFPHMAMTIDDEHTGENKVNVTLSFTEIVIVSSQTVVASLDLPETVGAPEEIDLGIRTAGLQPGPPNVGLG